MRRHKKRRIVRQRGGQLLPAALAAYTYGRKLARSFGKKKRPRGRR